MADPPILPDNLQPDVDAFRNKDVKTERLSKHAPVEVCARQTTLWRGRLADHLLQKERPDLLDQVGTPDMKNIALGGMKCGGAHGIGQECACGFGHCVSCGTWITGSCGWGVHCNKAACVAIHPSNVIPRPVIVAPVTPDPKPARKPASKKARGRAKRSKGQGGGYSTASDDSDELQFVPTTPPGSPPDSQTAGLWQPIPARKKTAPGGKKVAPTVKPTAQVKTLGGKGKNLKVVPPTAQACAIVHTPSDICEECGVNSCIICHQPKSKSVPWDAAKGYNCGCGGGMAPPPVAPVVPTQIDLTDDTTVPTDMTVALHAMYPKHWSPPQPGTSPYILQYVELKPGSKERQLVIDNYRDRNTMGGMMFKYGNAHDADYIADDIKRNPTMYTVEKVLRIQNLALETAYNGFLQGVMANRKLDLSDVEETVFHGTNEKALLSIAANGFNRFKTSTAAFGFGSYQDVYGPLSQHHAEGHTPSCVIVSKMASGVIGEGTFGNVEPPEGCDCGASGATKQSSMRVSYNDSQICPQYALYIKRKK